MGFFMKVVDKRLPLFLLASISCFAMETPAVFKVEQHPHGQHIGSYDEVFVNITVVDPENYNIAWIDVWKKPIDDKGYLDSGNSYQYITDQKEGVFKVSLGKIPANTHVEYGVQVQQRSTKQWYSHKRMGKMIYFTFDVVAP